MMNFFRKHMRVIFVIIIVGFVVGTFMGFGSYFSGSAKNYSVAATVNGAEIPMKLFTSIYDGTLDSIRQHSSDAPGEEALKKLKMETLKALIQDEIFYQQSKLYGIIVSDDELKLDIQNSPMFKTNNMFDPRLYYNFLHIMRMTPKDYEEFRRRQIAGEKLKMLIASSIKLSDAEYQEAVKAGAKITKEEMTQRKAMSILNDWLVKIAASSKITPNETILK